MVLRRLSTDAIDLRRLNRSRESSLAVSAQVTLVEDRLLPMSDFAMRSLTCESSNKAKEKAQNLGNKTTIRNKNKAAIALQRKSNVKLIAALLFIP